MSNGLESQTGLKTLLKEQYEEFRLVQIKPTVNEVQCYCDRECDQNPEMDNATDRDHFQPDPLTGQEPTDQEIDQVLDMFDNEYTRKTGRFEVPDLDEDEFNYEDEDE
jgi:hypothetical protein